MYKTTTEELANQEDVSVKVAKVLRKGLDKGVIDNREIDKLADNKEVKEGYFDLIELFDNRNIAIDFTEVEGI